MSTKHRSVPRSASPAPTGSQPNSNNATPETNAMPEATDRGRSKKAGKSANRDAPDSPAHDPPRPHRLLFAVSLVAFLLWSGFLTWLALFQ